MPVDDHSRCGVLTHEYRQEAFGKSSTPVGALLASARCAVGAPMILKPEVAEAKEQPCVRWCRRSEAMT